MAKNRARLAVAALVAATALSGCSPAAPTRPEDGRPVVLTTFSVLADLVREVAGDRAEVVSITKPGAEIHGYEPTPSDLARAHEADLVLDNGLGLERWFERFIADAAVPHQVLSEGVEPVPITLGSYEGRANPHAWMSPVAARIYVDNAVDALSRLSPADAGYFRANGERFKDELRALEAEMRDAFPRGGDRPSLVTCEGAFSYLARDLDFREHFLWPVNADSEGTPRQIRAQLEFVAEHRPPSVFCESTVNPSAQEQVARASGARLGGTLYVDSLSGPDGPVPTFIDLLRHDLETIREGLEP